MASVRYDGNKNVIGTRLRILRKKLNLKQGELAAKMQVLGFTMDQQAISNIERNRRVVTDFELAGFCKALRCSETDLLQDFYKKLND
ncbi:MAG: helix-turn-helix domain-containing protein [Oscillospiraceae bacterium]|nr:helix-turn-helix domain-containing protein [Oscillospiraceae bacterium]